MNSSAAGGKAAAFFDRHLANLPISHKLGLIIGIFLLVVTALLGVSHFGMAVLSDVRAYVGGEGLWSKAQKDAVYHLMRYAIFRESEDYEKYNGYLAVPLGDRKARLALERSPLDLKTVNEGFIEGRNHPQDVEGMAKLFRHFSFIRYIRDAASAWREGDALMSRLMFVGEDVHSYVRAGEPDMRKVKELLRRIDAINAKLTPIEDRFSYTLGEGARWLKLVLMAVMLSVTGFLLVLGLFIAIAIARRLAGEIERLRVAASGVARGDFSHPLDVESSDEIGDLARSFQQMAIQRGQVEEALARRAKELAEANQRLIETERIKDNFFATVSHELRTPLTLILSPLESLLMLEHGTLAAAQHNMLQTMHHNTVRLLQMVTGLLDFSKLEAGQMQVKREPMELVGMTRAMLADFEPIMRQRRLSGRIETKCAEIPVQMDRHLYERIVFNLLSNAVKFTPEGGRITVRLDWADEQLSVVVQDTGIGIAQQDIPHLFQKFHQLEGAATRRYEGTGLGLALVKEFSTLLGGGVSVDSIAGAGSTFRVAAYAPPASVSDSEVSVARPSSRLAVRGSGVHGEIFPFPVNGGENLPKLLIAEDNMELAWYIASLLKHTCQVTLAEDGEEALNLVNRLQPDLVILDVMMPKLDGLSLCHAIKARPETMTVPVILLTALTHRDALLKGWEAGADEYLFKPFHPKELVTRVSSMLSALKRRQQVEEERSRIFSLSLDLLCIADFDGRFRQLNPQWQRTLGFTVDELRAKPYIEFVHPQDREATRKEAERVAAGSALLTFENRFLCKDGSYKWLLWNALPIPNQRLIYAAARDVTDRIHAEQQLKRAHTDLKKSHDELKAAQMRLIQSAKMESVGRLAAGVAHEVKNPLAVILQGVDYLSKHMGGANGRTLVVLKHTGDAVRRADAVIRGLLDFSATRELELAAVDVGEVVDQALLLIKHELDCAHIAVNRKIGPGLPKATMDRTKMEQVLVNLLLNAVHAMPEGGSLAVTAHATQLTEVGEDVGERQRDRFRIGETVVVVEVDDTGSGIPEDMLEKAFDPFFSTKPTGKGTGLGLTVAKKIIELHNGMISLRNRPEGGVRATLVLKTEGGFVDGKDAGAAD